MQKNFEARTSSQQIFPQWASIDKNLLWWIFMACLPKNFKIIGYNELIIDYKTKISESI